MKCVFVKTRFYLKKGCRRDFYQKFRDNSITEMTRTEDGNLNFEIYFPWDSDDDICLLEKWKNVESFSNHKETLHNAILEELQDKYVIKTDEEMGWLNEIIVEELGTV